MSNLSKTNSSASNKTNTSKSIPPINTKVFTLINILIDNIDRQNLWEFKELKSRLESIKQACVLKGIDMVIFCNWNKKKS